MKQYYLYLDRLQGQTISHCHLLFFGDEIDDNEIDDNEIDNDADNDGDNGVLFKIYTFKLTQIFTKQKHFNLKLYILKLKLFSS